MSDVKIKFLRDYTVKDPENPDEYEKGEKVTMNEASANHFVRRGIAEFVTAPVKKPARKLRKADDDKPPPPPK